MTCDDSSPPLAAAGSPTTRPSYRHAVRWIAHQENPTGDDSTEDTSGYLTTHLVADLFGVESTALVALDIARERRKAGLRVRVDGTLPWVS